LRAGGKGFLIGTHGRSSSVTVEGDKTAWPYEVIPSPFAVSPDEKILYVANDERGVLEVMRAGDRQVLARVAAFYDGTWAVVDPEGRYDAANGGDLEQPPCVA